MNQEPELVTLVPGVRSYKVQGDENNWTHWLIKTGEIFSTCTMCNKRQKLGNGNCMDGGPYWICNDGEPTTQTEQLHKKLELLRKSRETTIQTKLI